MANEVSHYREMAARAHAEADQATLENARDRALRSAKTFEAMAEQHEQMLKRKLEREAQIQTRAAALSSTAVDRRETADI